MGENDRDIAIIPEGGISVKALKSRVMVVQEAMRDVMKEEQHYGMIPGTHGKKTLLKPGAELLCMMFGLKAQVEKVEITELAGEHRDYLVKMALVDVNGEVRAHGLGSCSTMEKKYRWRPGPSEITDKPVPKEYWSTRNTALLGGKGFGTKKNDSGKWMICIVGEAIENPDIADVWNTVLKMAKKRAFIDATLTATGASDSFSQDLDDDEVEKKDEKKAGQRRKAQEGQGQQEQDGGAKATPSKIKVIFAKLHAIGISDPKDQHDKVSEILGYDETITTMNKLTVEEADKAIEGLKVLEAEAKKNA